MQFSKFSKEVFLEANNGSNKVIFSSIKDGFEFYNENSPFSIKVCLYGTEHYRINSKHFTLTPGQFLIVNKGDTIENHHLDKGHITEGVCIYFDSDLINELHSSIVNSDIIEYTETEDVNFISGKYLLTNDNLSNTLLDIKKKLNQFERIDFFYNTAVKLIMQQIKIKDIFSDLNSLDKTTSLELYFRIEKAKSYILDNYKNPIDIDMLSKEACVSKFHLIRTFKKVYGMTPYNFLLNTRLNKAHQQILSNRYSSLSEIAASVGFSSTTSFIRSFKKNYGFSPYSLHNKDSIKSQ